MEKILVFAGTREGRQLAEHLCQYEKEVHVSVATEYGQEVMPAKEGLFVRQGRLNEREMILLLEQEEWLAVIDATHPFATEVSENVKSACKAAGREYLRLLRGSEGRSADEDIYWADTKEEAAEFLNGTEGNILLTTGSKELADYVSLIADISRLYVRILAEGETVNRCRELGLCGKQIICMQGPFSKELNEALLRQIDAKYLVTKETGETGGFPQKLAGAKAAGTRAVVIRRPGQEKGYSMEQLLAYLKLPALREEGAVITLLGIGMGALESMTLEAYRACREADVILGARRITEALAHFGKPMEPIYRPEEIVSFLAQNPRYKHVVAAFSGDVGFYSGTQKLLKALQQTKEGYRIRLVCGISSVAYAASRMQMPWQDMKLVSIHGRMQNIIGAVRTHEKVFSLAGSHESIQALGRELMEYGLGTVTMHVGAWLSYPREQIITGCPKDFTGYSIEGLSVVVIENPNGAKQPMTHGLPDEAFIRGKAPMTKEEVRSISLSKLALTRDALVYDIGAGTGSVGIECALQIPEGMVYAIEKKEEALELLLQNKRSLGAANLEIVAGTAPQALDKLPAPTHAFIGGSSGNLKEIIELLLLKNPRVRIVINAIAMETAAEIMAVMQERNFSLTDLVQVSVAKSKELGRYHMMMGQNPVYIVTLQQ